MTSTPNGESKAADENADAVANAKAATTKPKTPAKAAPKKAATPASPAEEAPLPEAPAPNQPLPEGEVQVTTPASEGEISDPGGKVTTTKKATAKRAKKDVLKDLDGAKLPVAVTVGQVTASIEEYAGRAVLSLSLVGWVGDAPMKVLAADADEIELALAELRKQVV